MRSRCIDDDQLYYNLANLYTLGCIRCLIRPSYARFLLNGHLIRLLPRDMIGLNPSCSSSCCQNQVGTSKLGVPNSEEEDGDPNIPIDQRRPLSWALEERHWHGQNGEGDAAMSTIHVLNTKHTAITVMLAK